MCSDFFVRLNEIRNIFYDMKYETLSWLFFGAEKCLKDFRGKKKTD